MKSERAVELDVDELNVGKGGGEEAGLEDPADDEALDGKEGVRQGLFLVRAFF